MQDRNTFCETFSFKINSFQNSPLPYIDSSISFVVVKTLAKEKRLALSKGSLGIE